MKRQPKAYFKSGPEKYVRTMHKLFVVFSVIAIPVFMVLLVNACNTAGTPKAVFIVATALCGLGYLCVYGFYAMHVSMGTAIGIEVSTKTVNIVTRRKTFTYDLRMGCVDMKFKKNKFVGTFETQDSRDRFVFYRHAPFTKYTDTQFTEKDIRQFYALLDTVEEE